VVVEIVYTFLTDIAMVDHFALENLARFAKSLVFSLFTLLFLCEGQEYLFLGFYQLFAWI